jgi:hypothetical protein
LAASPSPAPLQRLEKPLPAAVEETAAAATEQDLYVIGGFDAAGNSLRSVYVFDGNAWSAGPRLPIGLDHAAAATLDGRVYVAGGHSFGRDSAQVKIVHPPNIFPAENYSGPSSCAIGSRRRSVRRCHPHWSLTTQLRRSSSLFWLEPQRRRINRGGSDGVTNQLRF